MKTALDITKISNATDLFVRYSETDAMGVVHNSRFLIYFEDGFMSFLKALGINPVELTRQGVVFPIVHAHCVYKESARFGDHLEVTTRVLTLSTHSITCKHEIRRRADNEVLAHGELVRVCYSLDMEKLPLSNVLPLNE